MQITGINRFTAEVGLVSYTLLILFRNTLTGTARGAAAGRSRPRGDGLHPSPDADPRRVAARAVPAIMAGMRIATVTTISLTTVAAYIGAGGLGAPIFDAIQTGFKTEFIAAGALAIALAIVVDVLLVLCSAHHPVEPAPPARRLTCTPSSTPSTSSSTTSA